MSDLVMMVESVLSREETKRINFSLEGFWVNRLHFLGVVCALKNSTISVRHESELAPNDAKYSYTGDRFYFGFTEIAGNVTREATIVHEAVHAAMDISDLPQYLRVSEGCAYVAGALYMYYRNEQLIAAGRTPNLSGIHKAAWSLAALARTKVALTKDDAKELYAAIDAEDAYKGRLNQTERFDGVRLPA